jgi:acyl-CoA synthetase (AMP-forming)/AMP-acid ligase II
VRRDEQQDGARRGLNITGRIKDLVIRGGENIYPREIEEFLHTHPGILDAQVTGYPVIGPRLASARGRGSGLLRDPRR